MRQTKTTVPELIQSINIFFESQAEDKQRVSFQTLMISVCICNKNTKHLSKTSNYCKMLCNSYFFPHELFFCKITILNPILPKSKNGTKDLFTCPKTLCPSTNRIVSSFSGGTLSPDCTITGKFNVITLSALHDNVFFMAYSDQDQIT